MSHAGKEAERLVGFRSAPPRLGIAAGGSHSLFPRAPVSRRRRRRRRRLRGAPASFAAERGAHGAWSLPEPVRGQLLLQHNMEAAAPPPPPLLLVLFLLAASLLRCNLGSVAGTFVGPLLAHPAPFPPPCRLFRSRASGRGTPFVVEMEKFFATRERERRRRACVRAWGPARASRVGGGEVLWLGACVAAGRGAQGCGWGGWSPGEESFGRLL